jgi:hypothetical protein
MISGGHRRLISFVKLRIPMARLSRSCSGCMLRRPTQMIRYDQVPQCVRAATIGCVKMNLEFAACPDTVKRGHLPNDEQHLCQPGLWYIVTAQSRRVLTA